MAELVRPFCKVCGKDVTHQGYYGNTATGMIWCRECWDNSPEWAEIKRSGEPNTMSKAILLASISFLVLTLIYGVLIIFVAP